LLIIVVNATLLLRKYFIQHSLRFLLSLRTRLRPHLGSQFRKFLNHQTSFLRESSRLFAPQSGVNSEFCAKKVAQNWRKRLVYATGDGKNSTISLLI
jgi:hypothetical protein